jgi:hypothetical protein
MHWVVAAVLLGFGCSNATHVARPTPSPVALLDAGAAPRLRVRHDPVLHAPEQVETTLELTVSTSFTNTVLERGHTGVGLGLRSRGRLEVIGFTAGGDALVTYEIEEAALVGDVDPAIRPTVDAELAALQGARASWRMAPSGTVSELDIVAPQVSSSMQTRLSSLGQAIHDAAVVFPDAEIGVGARWQVRARPSLAGVTWDQTTTYQLRALTGTSATVEAETVMHARSQALRVEPTATTRLTSGTSRATSELIIPLRGLAATGASRTTTEANYSIVRKDLRITSTVQTEAAFSIRPRDTAAPGS